MRVRALLVTLLMAGCTAPTALPAVRLPGATPLSLFRSPRQPGELLVDQQEIFPAAFELIQGAQKSVQIDIFLFGATIGRKVADMLIAKQRAGVDVQLVTDPHLGYFGKVKNDTLPVLNHLKANGLEVRFYPTSKLKSSIPWLKVAEPVNHAKVLVADQELALVGGMNFMDREAINRDYMLRVRGDRARDLSALVDRDWHLSGTRSEERPEAPTGDWEIGETSIEDQTNPQLWLSTLKAATHRIDVEMLLMDHPEGVSALIDAHKRGVTVRVLLDKTNFGKHSVSVVEKLPLQGAPNWLAIKRLLEAGVPVGWYVPRQRWEMLHAKVCVVDGTTAIMGTTNFTRRAWHGNREVSVKIHDAAVIQRLSHEIDRDWQTRREPILQLTRWQRLVATIMQKVEDKLLSADEAERLIAGLQDEDPAAAL